MSWKVPKADELHTLIESWKSESDIRINPDATASAYRNILMKIHEDAKKNLGIDKVDGNEYRYDLLIGLGLYENLRISARTAADNDFWIYLGIRAVPDVVFWRWGSGAHERFYRTKSRIWLKSLWWYIHLSWQGNREDTARCLAMNSTDTIVQLVERSGPYGYRVDLCRTIMKRFYEYCRYRGKVDPKFFRQFMKLNTARLAAVEPALCEGAEDGYVRQLFAVLESQT